MVFLYGLPQEKNFEYKTIGSIAFYAEFQLHLFAEIAKPAWDSNPELLNKVILKDMKSSELTAKPTSTNKNQ